MQLKFLGHAAFLLEAGEVRLAVDPFITDNPTAPCSVNDVNAGWILITHGHFDHFGDTLEIAAKNSATVISVAEIAKYCADKGVQAHGMHIGGSHDFGKFTVKLTMALHGSSIGSSPAQYLGNPCGFLITINGKTIYHAGDTGLFGDMELIGRLHVIDYALLPIGDNFTMGPRDALEAVRMLRPKKVIPMHYNTWELINQNPKQFQETVERETGIPVIILQPGESINI
ncbi:beta-lactamase domain-containing protein [Thermincola ferriacetica]|uniref:UPF0173 metal-dependent hydrolase Tfer_3171 n=1 Tax=Thermincola ferriacetica TaxID=281456 RepID=A0A0L6VYM6_9FIRM|nr:metal-dependent hydrolase [Thermincola ferriacetica]KNZ68273.1 beta-lactamase domain-containing protein [Thermincola ferriacetica]